jgi:hypothetical protein
MGEEAIYVKQVQAAQSLPWVSSNGFQGEPSWILVLLFLSEIMISPRSDLVRYGVRSHTRITSGKIANAVLNRHVPFLQIPSTMPSARRLGFFFCWGHLIYQFGYKDKGSAQPTESGIVNKITCQVSGGTYFSNRRIDA